MNLFFDIVYYGSVFSPLLTLVNGLFFHSKRKDGFQAIFWLLPTISVISDLSIMWVCYLKMNAFFLVHIYTCIAGLIYLFYFKKQQILSKKVVLVMGVLYAITCVLNFTINDGYNWVNSFAGIFLCVIGIIGSLFYFFKSIRELKHEKFSDDLHFWINVSILVYFGLTFFISFFEQYIRSMSSSNFVYTFVIMYIGNILYNIVLTIGLWRTKQN